MIVMGGLVIGLLTGALFAQRRGGKIVDMAHYATVFGIAFMLAGLFVTLILGRILI